MTQEIRQWKGKTGGGRFGQKSLFIMLRWINVTFLYPFLFFVIPFYMLFAKKGRVAVMDYFKQSYQMSTWDAFWKTFKNHFVFGQIVLDKFAFISGNKKNFSVEVEGQAYFDTLSAKKNGFVITSAHIGNFEAGGFIFQQKNKKINALIYDGEAKKLQERRTKALQKANINPISVNEDMSHLFTIKQGLEKGELLLMPCDRTFGSTRKIKCTFLGRDAYFPLAPFRLATQLNVPMIALFMMKDNYKKYHAYIFPVTHDSEETNPAKKATQLAQSFAANCEKIVRKYPHQWFNFYDFWKL